jgi:hypothetical protein
MANPNNSSKTKLQHNPFVSFQSDLLARIEFPPLEYGRAPKQSATNLARVIIFAAFCALPPWVALLGLALICVGVIIQGWAGDQINFARLKFGLELILLTKKSE